MARSSKAAFAAYYRALPDELQALHLFFRAATEYHQVHATQVKASAQDRRYARSDLEARVFTQFGPPPVIRRCEQMMAADRAKRIAQIGERRRPRPDNVLRLNLNAGGGEVVPFRLADKAALHGKAQA